MTTNHSPPESGNQSENPKPDKKLAKQAQKVMINSFQKRIMPQTQRFSKMLKDRYQQIDIKNDRQQRRFVVGTFTFFIIWLFLVGTFSVSEVFVGLIVALLTAWLSSKHLVLIDAIKFNRAMLWFMLRYLLVFIVALIRANIDMARRVLSPHLPINPALVEVQTQLKSPLGKLILANSITLTPGTLTVDVIGDRLQVHWVDSTPGVDLEHATQAIAESFERHLQGFLE
ncbi:Predicted cation antiporter [Beggiatoa sp. PS]|nr:Predicted cation antiporter [Beggiatoa sp. PS]